MKWGWAGQLARRYVAWSERGVKQNLLELRLAALDASSASTQPPPGIRIEPLSVAGDEWLLGRAYNQAGCDAPGFRLARGIDLLAFATAPNHDPAGIFLAWAGTEVVGTCVTRVRGTELGGIYSMAVSLAWRRRGLGRALLDAGLQHLHRRGMREVQLWVHPENISARQFYTSAGFQVVSTDAEASLGSDTTGGSGTAAAAA